MIGNLAPGFVGDGFGGDDEGAIVGVGLVVDVGDAADFTVVNAMAFDEVEVVIPSGGEELSGHW